MGDVDRAKVEDVAQRPDGGALYKTMCKQEMHNTPMHERRTGGRWPDMWGHRALQESAVYTDLQNKYLLVHGFIHVLQ